MVGIISILRVVVLQKISFMKNTILFLLLLIPFISGAQNLEFNSDGKFKIVQFTDVHYIEGADGSQSSLDMMKSTLDAEKPDLVVFTGDVVVGHKQLAKSWDTVLDLVISRKIPYMVTFGNHDDEGEWSRPQIADYIAKKKFMVNNVPAINGVDGVLNGAITVKGRDGENSAVLYIMDSHAYSTLPKVKGYGWFTLSQIDWYKKESAKLNEANKDTLTALAFFHIALPEYNYAFNNAKNQRIGTRGEDECAPAINTGMFAAMLESGDVLGTFVGHDHVNDYLVDYYGVGLTYGCFSGSSNTYQRGKNGARVIELTEGERKFDTYIREYDGQEIDKTSFPFE